MYVSPLRNATRILRRTMLGPAGGSVVIDYKSGVSGQTYKGIRATLGAHIGASTVDEGGQFSWTEKVYKIDVLDLPVVPSRMDKVYEEVREGVIYTYKVLPSSGTRHVGPHGDYDDVWEVRVKWIPDEDQQGDVVYGAANGTAYGNADPEGTAYGRPRS